MPLRRCIVPQASVGQRRTRPSVDSVDSHVGLAVGMLFSPLSNQPSHQRRFARHPMWVLLVVLASVVLQGHCIQETEEARISRLIKQGKGVVAEEVDVSGIYGQQSWTASPGQEARRGTEIPKIIHQQWKSYSLPLHFNFWAKTWTDHHPDWQYRFWTSKHNRRFVAR